MFIIYGARDYGSIDGPDGDSLATRFIHLYYLPLIPIGGRRVLPDGTPQDAPLSFKSMGLAYARVWGFAAAIGLTVKSYLELEKSLGVGLAWTAVTALLLLGVLALWTWAGLKGPSRPLNLALGFGIPYAALAIVVYFGVTERLHRAHMEALSAKRDTPSLPAGVSPELYELAKAMAGQEAKQRAEQLDRRCDEGDVKACNHLGVELGKADPDAAKHAYRRGCDGASGIACFNLGVVTAKTDKPAAAPYYELACRYGYADGCNNYAASLDASAAKEAAELFDRGCELGSKLGCMNLAKRYEVGSGVAKSRKQALAYYRRACDLGASSACAR